MFGNLSVLWHFQSIAIHCKNYIAKQIFGHLSVFLLRHHLARQYSNKLMNIQEPSRRYRGGGSEKIEKVIKKKKLKGGKN